MTPDKFLIDVLRQPKGKEFVQPFANKSSANAAIRRTVKRDLAIDRLTDLDAFKTYPLYA